MLTNLLIILALAYFVPSLIALARGNNFPAVFALNLLLGWTFVGWVIALVWSLTAAPRWASAGQLSQSGDPRADRVLATLLHEPEFSDQPWKALQLDQALLLKKSGEEKWSVATEIGALGFLDADSARVVSFRSEAIGLPRCRVMRLDWLEGARTADIEITFRR
jgi:hypothetical protein